MVGRKMHFVAAVVVVVGGAIVERVLGDAQTDYQQKWGAKEKMATSPAERAKLAGQLMDATDELIAGKKGMKSDKPESLAKSQGALESLRGDRRDEALLLCQKAYQLGSKQRESYAAAARALGVIQILDSGARLDSLVKLQKLYEDCYRGLSSTNVGIAKGLAEVCLQAGDEQFHQWRQNKETASPAQQAAAVKAIAANYARGLEVIRSAISTIRPYAAGNQAYEGFMAQAGGVEKELVVSQKKVAEPLAQMTELDRVVKVQQTLQARLASNPKDTVAADRLVRLYRNELDDPKALEVVLPHASPAVQSAVALMKKPVGKLSAADALAVVQWCDKNNDNPGSANRTSMDILTRVYCAAYLKATKPQDSAVGAVEETLAHLDADLAKAKMPEEQIAKLTETYVAALEPPAPVAPTPEPAPSPPAPNEPAVAAGGDTPPTPVPDPIPAPPPAPAPVEEKPRQVTSIKVDNPSKAKDDGDTDANRDTRPTIFDFGRD